MSAGDARAIAASLTGRGVESQGDGEPEAPAIRQLGDFSLSTSFSYEPVRMIWSNWAR
jgi:hypothetical protein